MRTAEEGCHDDDSPAARARGCWLALPLQAPSTLGTAGSVASGPFEPGRVVAPIAFSDVPAIWPQANRPLTDPPPAHEVALFRHTFSLTAPLGNAELAVFADTRYELWLDGTWIGRGPARFSRQTHEYDIYALPALSTGEHILAALVQWSPNMRRSESVQPMLQLQLTHDGHVIAQTDSSWKAIRSPAWNTAAAPVHTWNLIGATELLDFNRLPPDWTQLSFDDSYWPRARQQPQPTARYRPRSIPPLANIPVPARVMQRGRLAPGATLIELQPDIQGEQRLAFTAAITSALTIETLPGAGMAGATPPQAIAIGLFGGPQAQPLWLEAEVDGATLAWTAEDNWHPDIRRASATLRPAVQRFMIQLAQLEHPHTGLLDIPKVNWSESALIDWAAFYSPTGPVVYGQSTSVNALYYGSLRDAAALAGWMGDAPFETAWHARADQVRERCKAKVNAEPRTRAGNSSSRRSRSHGQAGQRLRASSSAGDADRRAQQR